MWRYFVIFIFDIMLCCTGDCKSCHQNLNYTSDIRHISMLSCKECHTDEKMAKIDMGGCGADCFACHDASKLKNPALSSSHKVIDSCMSCHNSLKVSPISSGESAFSHGIKVFNDELLDLLK